MEEREANRVLIFNFRKVESNLRQRNARRIEKALKTIFPSFELRNEIREERNPWAQDGNKDATQLQNRGGQVDCRPEEPLTQITVLRECQQRKERRESNKGQQPIPNPKLKGQPILNDD